jgi:transposase
MKYSGIDLHSNNSVVVVTDESDRIIVSRRVPNSLPSMLAVLDPYRHDVVGVVVEATYNWYWLVDGLQAAGYRVHLANTAAIKRYEGLKRSGDEADGSLSCPLGLRLGLLPEGYICPKQQRAVRDLARKRMQLVRSRTQHILAVENIQARESGSRMKAEQIKAAGCAIGADDAADAGGEAGAAGESGGHRHTHPADRQARGLLA